MWNNGNLVCMNDAICQKMGLLTNKAGFFSHLPKNSRTKKLKLKKNFPKTQGFLAHKLKKPEIFGQIYIKNSNFSQKLTFFSEKFENFLETQGFFKNSSPKSVKNSRNRKLHLLYLPKKRLKKPCCKCNPIKIFVQTS